MINKKTAMAWLAWVEQQFESAELYYGHGQENSHDEAVQLLFFICGMTDDTVWDHVLSEQQVEDLQALVSKRIKSRQPLAYLTQQAWFMGLPFYVDERVLIPRSPLAEWIDYRFSPWIEAAQVHDILEIGTGSGCIAIACAEAFPSATIDAVDISEDALAVAAKNVAHYRLDERVTLIQSDIFAAITAHEYQVIISNPPYVGTAEVSALPKEYQFEPIELALHSGSDGLIVPLKILHQAADYLSDGGILIMELGNSAVLLQQRYPNVPFTWLEQEMGGHGILLMSKAELMRYKNNLLK